MRILTTFEQQENELAEKWAKIRQDALQTDHVESAMRWCDDIGMFAIDRPIEATCAWRTEYCADGCFNNKLYRAFGHGMHPKDVKNERYWQALTGERLRAELERKRKQTKRVRLVTRGEALEKRSDIFKVKALAIANPESVFWVPTKCWRNAKMRRLAEEHLSVLGNVRLMASTDPDTTPAQWKMLKRQNWNILHFGNDDWVSAPTGERFFKCPKTFQHLAAHCAICKGGCFNTRKRVMVLLKQH